MPKNVEIVDRSEKKKCRTCTGTGKPCRECDGSGVYIEPNYFLIVEQTDGQKIAFQSDFIGK